MATHASIEGLRSVQAKLSKIASGPNHIPVVKVGVVESAKYPLETMEGRPKRKPPPPEVAQVAFWNEFGTKKGGRLGKSQLGPIPSRPFMRQSAEDMKNNPNLLVKIKELFSLDEEEMRTKLGRRIGEMLKAIMISKFRDNDFEPNAPLTVFFKTKGKGGRTTPLYDTGQLVQAIDYELYKAGEIDTDAPRSR